MHFLVEYEHSYATLNFECEEDVTTSRYVCCKERHELSDK